MAYDFNFNYFIDSTGKKERTLHPDECFCPRCCEGRTVVKHQFHFNELDKLNEVLLLDILQHAGMDLFIDYSGHIKPSKGIFGWFDSGCNRTFYWKSDCNPNTQVTQETSVPEPEKSYGQGFPYVPPIVTETDPDDAKTLASLVGSGSITLDQARELLNLQIESKIHKVQMETLLGKEISKVSTKKKVSFEDNDKPRSIDLHHED